MISSSLRLPSMERFSGVDSKVWHWPLMNERP
jgi:hypothetical protein